MKIELYKATSHGIRYWSVEADYDWACIDIRHGRLNGAMQEQREDVEENNSGRSLEEQIDLRMESRATGKRDIGYRETIEEAKACVGNNTMGHFSPMLAKRIDKISNIDYDHAYLQMKYDGHRCLVTRTSTGIIAYSRNGRRITSIDHILEHMKIPIGVTIDGELYCHGIALQTITSWAKREQENTKRLEYIVYDTVSDEGYEKRYNDIKHFWLGKNARVAPTDKTVNPNTIALNLQTAVAMGYEGLIMRELGHPYEPGKRSNGLIKIKHFMDSEFKVIDMKESADNWAILVCEVRPGLTFDVSAPGTIHQKRLTLLNRDRYVGQSVTVKFANYTKAGKPFHPVAERWRVDI